MHEWCITGHDMQVLSMTVPPGETIVTEVGSFMYMHPGMETKVECTLCECSKCGEGWNRVCGGESCVKVLLMNQSGDQGYVGLTPNFPAKVRIVFCLSAVQESIRMHCCDGHFIKAFTD